ncbi:MAG TPA: hypothetical protein VLQ90_08915 [Pyrinomonadaceae bacterium]|nr:hypothetical protein [Pyrinomonadaceae bacterium]
MNCGEVVARFQPRSRGLPAGLPDQPLYGWVQDAQTRILQPVSTGFVEAALAVMLKRLIGSTLKRADSLERPRYPALKALV